MKPFFNLGCALVAWTTLARLAPASQQGRALWSLPMEAFRQGAHAHQLSYEKSDGLLERYHALLVEPLLLLDRPQDGRWRLMEAEGGNELDQLLQQQLGRVIEPLPIARVDAAGKGIARLRVALASRQNCLSGQEREAQGFRMVLRLPALSQHMEPYLQEVCVIAQLEDSEEHTLLAGGITLTPPRQMRAHPVEGGWRQLLLHDWLQTMQNALQPASGALAT